LKLGFFAAFVIPMAVMIFGSIGNSKRIPPYPERIISGGVVLTDKAAIMRGQRVWQKYGLMDQGSVWGHGSLRGMDFSAQTLHIIGRDIRSFLSQQRFGKGYDALDREGKAVIDALTILDIRTNTYDAKTRDLTLSPAKASAFRDLQGYWESFFLKGDVLHGFLPNTIRGADERRDIASFFFWTAWAAGTTRPGSSLTYTNNWPADRSVQYRA
jgi:nitric oxide reductase subunit B